MCPVVPEASTVKHGAEFHLVKTVGLLTKDCGSAILEFGLEGLVSFHTQRVARVTRCATGCVYRTRGEEHHVSLLFGCKHAQAEPVMMCHPSCVTRGRRHWLCEGLVRPTGALRAIHRR